MSSKGQVIIPKSLCSAHHWDTDQELIVIDALDGVLLKPKVSFEQTDIADIAGCLAYYRQIEKSGRDGDGCSSWNI